MDGYELVVGFRIVQDDYWIREFDADEDGYCSTNYECTESEDCVTVSDEFVVGGFSSDDDWIRIA